MSETHGPYLLKLQSGEVIICRVAADEEPEWKALLTYDYDFLLSLEDILMLQYVMQQQSNAPNIGISFVPWMSKSTLMRARGIVAVSEPPKDMADYYLSVTSGIQIAHRGPPNLRPVQ